MPRLGLGVRCGRKEVESCAVCGGCGLLKMGFLAEGQVEKFPRNVRKIIAKLLGHCGVGVGLQAGVGRANLVW